ncbi:MAG: glycoside hydrolase family 3 C-terminal domain-containing protein, partial [Prevotella sp.]|nr:glycoside hydrolase family 3 C-terminal domain-containing protein [Prevotella sp.]
MKRLIFVTLTTLSSLTISAQQLPYQNPNLSPAERAADLCSRLTLEEKALLMMDRSPAIPRLGIPQFEWWNETLHGVGRNGIATVFPITMGMAASFDDALVYKVFTAASDEARAKNTEARRNGEMARYRGLSFWTPNINIFRDPRWGRGQETYGEDPYLTTRMGLAVVNGLQGQDFEKGTSNSRYKKLFACAKHYAVHSGPEWNRHEFNIENLPERDLWETYLHAFKALVQEADVKEIMCAYQSIDGEPCCGNTRYLQRILRDEWGFKGIVTSDCGAIDDFFKPNRHNFVKTASEASSSAVIAGTDVECGSIYRSLPSAVKEGKITEAQIDISLKRLLQGRFELGDFDPDELVEWTKIPMSVVASKKHKQLAIDAAQESIVLLKNNSILPLSSNSDKIVVMGPNANDSTMLWGNYNGQPTHTTTILQGIRQYLPNVKYIQGCTLTRNEVPVSMFNSIYTPDGQRGFKT